MSVNETTDDVSICFVLQIYHPDKDKTVCIYPGIQFSLPCIPWTIFRGCQIVDWDPGMRNGVVLKNIWYGLCENAWFQWQPIADLRMGVCLQKYSYLSCSLTTTQWRQ